MNIDQAPEEVATVHLSFRVLIRHMRLYLSVVGGLFVIGAALSAAGLALAHPGPGAGVHSGSPPGLVVTLAAWTFLAATAMLWFARRVGYFSRPGEVGTIGVFGRFHPLRQPAAGFHRCTLTNLSGVQWIGLGEFVAMPMVVALNGEGKRIFVLSPFFQRDADIDRLVAVSGLPVDGDWSERIPRFSLRTRYPASEDARAQLLTAWRFGLVVTVAWVAIGVALVLLVHP